MKLKNLLLVGMLMILSIVSCKKDSPASSYPIAGLYLGTYTVNGSSPQATFFYSIVIYPDGTATTKAKGNDGVYYYSAGTWTLTGSAFSATIVSFLKYTNGIPVTQVINATYSNTGSLTNGTWKDTVNPSGVMNSGNLSIMQRVN